MIDNVLERKQLSLRMKITLKSLISAGMIALAVVLPQIAHLAVGAQAGVMLLPMYLPVLLGSCILGARWGTAVGVLSPLVSYLITSAFGSPMPAAARLPFMMAELAIFALVSGMFSKLIEKHSWMAFPAVIAAEICGRAFFMLLVTVFAGITPFTPAMIWGQIKTGFVGLAIQAVLVPLIVIGLGYLLKKNNSDENRNENE